jgi:tRNA(Ile)-lysidine synthase
MGTGRSVHAHAGRRSQELTGGDRVACPLFRNDMLERVATTISRYNMLAPDSRVIVAASGGPDSICLLHALRELKIRVVGIAHVNHKLRGEASEADERFVGVMAREMELPFHSTVAPCGEGNLEQTARRARRAFFQDLIGRGLAQKIALGHTRDDQAETVLFRILRGSGLAGLAGILPVTAEGIIRPLLDVTRGEVHTFLRERGILWREDSSNQETRFARNRIRQELLPRLKQDWNPGLTASLAHLADLAYGEELWWAGEIARLARQMFTRSPGALEVSARELSQLPRAVARRLLRHAIRLTKGNLYGVQFSHIEHVLELPESGGKAELPGIHAIRSFDWLRLAVPGQMRQNPLEGEVPVPGRRISPDGNSMICLDLIRRKQRADACATLKSDLYFAAIPERLVLRGWKPGDRYCPVGHTNDRKLKELFQRERIPSWRRPFWPILCCGDKILWARDFGPAAERGWQSGGGQIRVSIREVRLGK